MLWAYHTGPRRSTGETPFSSIGASDFSSKNNDACVAEQLDLLEERQEMALIRLADYQQKLAHRYDRNVKPR